MVLETKELIKSGLNNIDEIKKIMGPESKLLDIVNGDYITIDDIKEKDYFKFNFYKAEYNLKKYFNIFVDTFNDELDIVFNTNISYYDILLNVFFLTFVVIVVVIMYWDSVYRNARNNSRCAVIDNIINENKVLQKPYIYNIYIVKRDNEDSFKDDYLILLKYDFSKKTTTYDYNIDIPINSIYKEESTEEFRYYDINNSLYNYFKNSNKDKIIADINNGKLIVIITDDNFFRINTEHSNALKEFVKNNNNNKEESLEPIYNIINAYNKNKSSDY